MTLLAWAYLLTGAGVGEMTAMNGMPPSASWSLTAAMWAAMMVAMMVPSAAPAILLFAKVHRHALGPNITPPATAILAGYLGCWFGFAGLAAELQLALGNAMIVGHSAAAALLIAAGLYQLSPLKDACLTRCRSPALFLARHYRPGVWGAVRLGLLHGAYCVGCCWLLMALLFVGGVMNLGWVALLTLLVAAEKLLPGGQWIARISGAGLIFWGIAKLITEAPVAPLQIIRREHSSRTCR
jgi:predicted metal-binding membrane protein